MASLSSSPPRIKCDTVAGMGRHKSTEPKPPCTIEGCQTLSKCKGLCDRHYAARLRRLRPERIKAARDRYRAKPENRATEAKSSKEWRRKNPGRSRDIWYKYQHKIGLVEYTKMFDAQDRRCAICLGEKPIHGKFFHVDHDHATGVIRGLLCSNCNLALGLFRDNQERIVRAIEYLKRGASEANPWQAIKPRSPRRPVDKKDRG